MAMTTPQMFQSKRTAREADTDELSDLRVVNSEHPKLRNSQIVRSRKSKSMRKHGNECCRTHPCLPWRPMIKADLFQRHKLG